MSYKAKIKPLFLLFSLFLTGLFFNVQNVYAVDYLKQTTTYNQVALNSAYYDSNNILTMDWTFLPSGNYTSGMYISKSSMSTSIIFSGGSTYGLELGNWLCEFGTEEYNFSGNMVYIIRPEDGMVSCKALKAQKGWWQGVYNGQSITNSTGLTKTQLDNFLGNNWLETYFKVPEVSPFISGGVNDAYSIFGNGYYPTENNSASIGGGIPWATGTAFSFPFQTFSFIDGTCGLDNGQTISTAPPTPPRTLCSSGTATSVLYSDYSWFWTCEGSGGGTTANCIAYETFVPATCGSDNGQTVSEVDDFCSYGTVAPFSYVYTTTGWNWNCQRDTTMAHCSAIRGTELPPELPDLEDCSLLSVPDKWFCQISNAVQGAFLPTPSKLNELNTTVNVIGQRFPFNYITSAKYSIETISISTAVPTITIMGNTGLLNINAISNFATVVRNGTSILIIFAFLFWLIGYIKNFFR